MGDPALRLGRLPDRHHPWARRRGKRTAASLVDRSHGVRRVDRRRRTRGRSAVWLVRQAALRRLRARDGLGRPETLSVYDPIARLYDPWSASVVEDVSFYVDEALSAGDELVELGVGTGRIAIPTAMAGASVIGVDSSPGMLAVCARRAQEAGVEARLDLRLRDLRRTAGDERVPLITCPFRSYLHLRDDHERLEALAAARELLQSGGRL